MFDAIKRLFVAPIERTFSDSTIPDKSCMRRAWVVLKDGRVGYIDHYKADGFFGVRPVNPETGFHYANPSSHWTDEQRKSIPEELALSIADLRGAQRTEIPIMYRLGVRL